uniref:Putative secreted protein n=1 Tax=Ixodes ricinus TaxID=34613 RepID=A0A6B0TUU9_IXORI
MSSAEASPWSVNQLKKVLGCSWALLRLLFICDCRCLCRFVRSMSSFHLMGVDWEAGSPEEPRWNSLMSTSFSK